MSTPIPGVMYQRHHPNAAWRARGRASIEPPTPDPVNWTPAALGFVPRPTGANYVRIEDLGVGNNLRAAARHPSANGKILTLPVGSFTLNDFTQGDGGVFMHGLMMHTGVYPNANIRGIVGSGEGTVIQMEANSSHFTMESAKQNTSPPQYLTTLIWFYQIDNVEFGNLTLQGTEQPHLYHGLRINGANARVHHVKFKGAGYGTFNMPPGETYSLAIAGVNPLIEDCEFDGRRAASGQPVSSTVVGVLGCTNAVIRRCYAHDMLSGFGVVQWQGAGLTTEDFWVARPGSGTGGYNGAHTNHEMGTGPIRHIRPHIDLNAWWGPTDGRTRRNNGKFGHFVFLQETTPSQSKPAAYADTEIIDPVFDSWGGIAGGLAITIDTISPLPKVIRGGAQMSPVVRPKWWEDKPTPFNPATQFWVTDTEGDGSVWG